MPFAPLGQPSLALSLLQASLAPGRAVILYETLRFASIVGPDRYEHIVAGPSPSAHLVGEWIFAEAAFGPDADRDRAYTDQFLIDPEGHQRDRAHGAERRAVALECRESVESFLDEALERVLQLEPRIVGFTSVFQQQVASLALARQIKESGSDAVVVFGGANCEGPMGRAVLANFPIVDLVVSGEGEIPFVELVDRVDRGIPLDGCPGVITRRDVAPLAIRRSDRPPPIAMDDLPIPDFADFFEQWSSLDALSGRTPNLLFESARGCWWGALRHCTFCGLNGEGMRFRSKSADRAVAELCELTSRHPGLYVYAVDNIIDRGYFDTFLPRLAASSCDARIFYEVKANLTKDQLLVLHSAGVRDIQPGIESLHDSVLRIMRKGVTAIENVQLLKWCAEIGIRPYWNLLWGFPGEPSSAFDEMVGLIPKLVHLQPPVGMGAIRVDRFSPNFEQASELGIRDVRPVPAYRSIYGLPDDELAQLAYFFAFDDGELRTHAASIVELEDAVVGWRSRHADSDLWAIDDDRQLVIWDTRRPGAPVDTRLDGLERELYLACDRCQSARELATSISRSIDDPISGDAVSAALAPLVDAGLMVTDGRRYLALARLLGDQPVPARFLLRFALGLAGPDDGVGSSAGMRPCGVT